MKSKNIMQLPKIIVVAFINVESIDGCKALSFAVSENQTNIIKLRRNFNDFSKYL